MNRWEERALELAKRWGERAGEYDRTGSFPFQNFEELKKEGFLTLTVPKEYGGEDFSLSQLIRILEILAQGDASTALGLGWHLGIIMKLRDSRLWPEEKFQRLCHEVVESGAMINSIATEPATGSPSRGGKPTTKAVKDEGGWRIIGHKTWGTLSPILTYFIITASIEGEEEVGEFLVHRDREGLMIEETWDSLGMRATGSHDLFFRNLFLPDEDLVFRKGPNRPSPGREDYGGWLLHIPATYLGIAEAARNFILQYVKEYRPNSIGQPIATLPSVREKIGEMELKLFTARTVLYATAREWDENPEERKGLVGRLSATKMVVTNAAIEGVDLAMRIMGGHSLLKKYPLERYYRDVRAGLHNPPMDDSTIRLLAQEALGD
ncbi:acyl-CoA dehydrogenase family protein [Thermicanus aegyptius]|uniref:acyl-CoA dehydrogenase family protein n=1 Tax=Thermicanus aegyptius TaxID=94009 RepID=UPI001FE13B1E|nr:acyl-CoA dehydrogenase family protein [Thermicanus aegyptius]